MSQNDGITEERQNAAFNLLLEHVRLRDVAANLRLIKQRMEYGRSVPGERATLYEETGAGEIEVGAAARRALFDAVDMMLATPAQLTYMLDVAERVYELTAHQRIESSARAIVANRVPAEQGDV